MESATQTPSIIHNSSSRVPYTHDMPASKSYAHQIPRYHDRIHLDAFRSPFNPLSYQYEQSDRPFPSHTSLPEGQNTPDDITVSPRTVPLSLRATDRRKYSSNAAPPYSTSPGPLREFDGPVLNIRRTPSKTTGRIITDVSELHLDETLDDSEKKKHGPSGSALNPEMACADESSAEARAPSCDELHCTHHHHRQRSCSIISIKCDRSDDGDGGEVDGAAEPSNCFLVGDIEGTIQLEPMAPSMLVPLIDREGEMADLLVHPSNQRWVGLVQHAVGKDVYKEKCIPLWCQTARADLSDIEWLWQSKKLLTKSHDNRLWRDFCGVVGWDEEAIPSPLEVQHSQRSKRESSNSLRSNSSANMNAIEEEPELGEEDECLV